MPRRPPLSKGETDIARAIWDLGEGTVGQIFEALSGLKDIDYTTVQTYIRRLETKGYISSRRVGRNKIYRAKVRSHQVIGEAIDDLMNRLFDGQVVPMMRHLIEDRNIGEAELQALRELLAAAEEKRDDPKH